MVLLWIPAVLFGIWATVEYPGLVGLPMSHPAGSMKSGNGSHELTRLATAYLTSIAFGLSFLVASSCGVDGWTALWRSVLAGGAAFVLGHLLAMPVVDTVLAAMARDEARRQTEGKKENGA
jgi:uncharacterized membrane protein YagU involved in acid resistance